MLRGSDLSTLHDKVNGASNRLRFLLEPRAAFEKGVCFGFQLFSFCGVKLTFTIVSNFHSHWTSTTKRQARMYIFRVVENS